MKDIICENNKEFELITKFLNLKMADDATKRFPILLFNASLSIESRWRWVDSYKGGPEYSNNAIYAKNIIRQIKLNKINDGKGY